jgi:hypothetical protein
MFDPMRTSCWVAQNSSACEPSLSSCPHFCAKPTAPLAQAGSHHTRENFHTRSTLCERHAGLPKILRLVSPPYPLAPTFAPSRRPHSPRQGAHHTRENFHTRKKSLGIRSRRIGFGRRSQWLWQLPRQNEVHPSNQSGDKNDGERGNVALTIPTEWIDGSLLLRIEIRPSAGLVTRFAWRDWRKWALNPASG